MNKTCRDINELTPKAQKACRMFLEECKHQGLNVLVTETYRSQERQNYLYEQGRTRKGKKVTWTKNSRHTSRRAWDICQNIKGQEYSNTTFFRMCGKIAKSMGITWGGDWSTPDMPHFEISESWEEYKGDEEPMTAEEKKKFNALVEQVESLTKRIDTLNEKVYHYTLELPEYAKPTIQKLLNKGIYAGASESDLNLPETLMRVLVINDRAGLYD
jgi:peptidoglycan L-alanyl-D-glutamate endopeptidase CwlK